MLSTFIDTQMQFYKFYIVYANRLRRDMEEH